MIEAASEQDRLVIHYDLFFDDAERELRRIADFIGIPDAAVDKRCDAGKEAKRRHTHFSLDDLIDARVSGEVIELYRALIAEAIEEHEKDSAAAKRISKPLETATQPDLLPERSPG